MSNKVAQPEGSGPRPALKALKSLWALRARKIRNMEVEIVSNYTG